MVESTGDLREESGRRLAIIQKSERVRHLEVVEEIFMETGKSRWRTQLKWSALRKER